MPPISAVPGLLFDNFRKEKLIIAQVFIRPVK